MKTTAAIALALATCLSPFAWGHAHLRQPAPAENSTVEAPAEVRLNFTEGVELAFSEVTLVAASGQTVTTRLSLASDNPATLIATPAAALGSGTWEVRWKVVSVDTHRSEGHYNFKVK